jgi:hypothetical protein
MKKRIPKDLGGWEDKDGIVHICFRWTSALGRGMWSTVCMVQDSLTEFVIDDHGYQTPTCVACVAGIVLDDG